MDKARLIDEICEELDSFPNQTKKRELIELFVEVMATKTDVSELAGTDHIGDRHSERVFGDLPIGDSHLEHCVNNRVSYLTNRNAELLPA